MHGFMHGSTVQWETWQASFPTGRVGPRVGIFLSPLDTNDGFYYSYTRVIFYVRRIGLYLYKYRIYGTISIYILKGLSSFYPLIYILHHKRLVPSSYLALNRA